VNFVADIPRIAPVLARHALGYTDLATEELQAAETLLRRRMLATTLYAIAAGFSVLMFCFLAIAVAWDTPHRITVAAGLALAFVTAAIIAREVARRERRKSAQLFRRLRSAWMTDRNTLRELLAVRETNS
jgi:uncharacterized membrane protein YqjE